MKTPPGLDSPVGTIWCIGRNYAEHARELGHAVPEAPLVFIKPASCLLFDGGTLLLPADSRRVDHEVELVVALGPELKMAVGVDFTARDLQQTAKSQGLPWTLAKARPGFAAVGNFVPYRGGASFSLAVNGTPRQEGSTGMMLVGVERLIDYLCARFPVEPGDLLYTGTPAGVGVVVAGDRVEARLGDGESLLRLTVAAP
ncbi:MAG: fumarylacetoacetate hydrolase family protein [Elusimicrobiota bacterium]|nr:fumarylacetoacetate hydrolase family protein [Elusimicrobiota bacterium]